MFDVCIIVIEDILQLESMISPQYIGTVWKPRGSHRSKGSKVGPYSCELLVWLSWAPSNNQKIAE